MAQNIRVARSGWGFLEVHRRPPEGIQGHPSTAHFIISCKGA
jgi:hypothetical protein